MNTRSRIRQVALQALYQMDQPTAPDPGRIAEFIRGRLSGIEHVRFAHELVDGVWRVRDELDALVSRAADNWALERMAVVDRNVLRLGAYELLHCDETPPKVAIDEAIELAKQFSTGQSAAFVNGVLDRVFRENCGDQAFGGPGAEGITDHSPAVPRE